MKEKRSPYDYVQLINDALKSIIELIKTRKLMTLLISTALVSLGGNGYQAVNNYKKDRQLGELIEEYRNIAKEMPSPQKPLMTEPITIQPPKEIIIKETVIEKPVTVIEKADCKRCERMIRDHILGDLH